MEAWDHLVVLTTGRFFPGSYVTMAVARVPTVCASASLVDTQVPLNPSWLVGIPMGCTCLSDCEGRGQRDALDCPYS